MNNITKQTILSSQLEKIMKKNFPEYEVTKTRELTEGFFNVAYEVTLSNGKELIVKIAPAKGIKVMRGEENIMLSEVLGLRKIKALTNLPIPKVYVYDDSHELLNAPYFCMEKIQGTSLFSYKEKHKEFDDSAIMYEVGKMNRTMNEIEGELFGYYAKKDKQKKSWYEAFYDMLMDTFLDAKDISLERGVQENEVFALLKKHKAYFDEVKTPKFVHWDLWDGNVFIKDKQITGMIDFERAMYADPLMECAFRCFAKNKHFLEGYGKTSFTHTEEIRMRWYDFYLFSIMSLEYDYRQYESKEGHVWALSMLQEAFCDLKKF